MPDRWQQQFFIHHVCVNPKRNLITRHETENQVEPKVMDVLCVLAAEGGDVISRDDLMMKVWGDSGGGDERLTRAISQLRKSLGDDPRNPEYIETVPKRGYRLCAPVSIELPVTSAPAEHSPAEANRVDDVIAESRGPAHGQWLKWAFAAGLSVCLIIVLFFLSASV